MENPLLLLFNGLSTLVLAAHVWVLTKEEDWGRKKPWGLFAIFLSLVSISLGNALVEKEHALRAVLLAVAVSQSAAIGISLLWIWAKRISSPSKGAKSTQKSRTGGANTSSRERRVNGYVYVAENPEIPGKVKIGHTTRTVSKRMKELSRSTGVPGKYKATYKIGVARPKRVEKKVHQKLSHRRIQDGGEFFKVDPEEAARVIKKVRG